MSHNEFNELRHTVAALPPEQMRQLRDELDRKLSALPVAGADPDADPLLGSASDHAELIDQIVEEAMQHREHQPWRLSTSE